MTQIPSPKRVLLKVSGELLGGKERVGIDPTTIERIANDIRAVQKDGYQIAIVTGGGNFYRGRTRADVIKKSVADRMGMLGSVMSALGLAEALRASGVSAEALSMVTMPQFVETFQVETAERLLENSSVAVIGGGTATPGFTTDTAAVAAAHMLTCERVLKGTDVDGVYNKNPMEYDDAVRYDRLTFKEALEQELHVMDLAAFALAQEENLPITVFSIHVENAVQQAVRGEIGTRVERA